MIPANPTPPPDSEATLLTRARALAGLSLQQIAQQQGVCLPADLRRDKGFVGQLLEKVLGATAGSQPIPDFPALGIELKTLPIDRRGKPLESTYISIVPLLNTVGLTWETSELRAKLMRILWIPIEAESQLPLATRRIGNALLWSPTPEQAAQLRADWQELMDMVAMGQLEKITARLGVYLQIRPKGANARALCWGINEWGEKIQTLPRGFYLRPSFTHMLLNYGYNQG